MTRRNTEGLGIICSDATRNLWRKYKPMNPEGVPAAYFICADGETRYNNERGEQVHYGN